MSDSAAAIASLLRFGRWASAATLLLALVLADCGGGSRPTAPPTPAPTPPPVTQPPTPTTLADLSASIESPQADMVINCSSDVAARVTLVNRGGTSVTVTGLSGNVGIPEGRCLGGGDFLVRPRVDVALPGTSTVVFNQTLFPNGSGCCVGKDCGSSCRFLIAFDVVTDLGRVPAGNFRYQVFFQNCQSCAKAAAAGGVPCGRPMPGAGASE